MKFNRNYGDTPESTGGFVLPLGEYMFQIATVEDAETKTGYPMAKVTFQVIDEGIYYGRTVKYCVLFPPNGSEQELIMGKTKRFLHCICEPYQGNFDVDTQRWIGKFVKAKAGPNKEGKYTNIMAFLLDESVEKENNNFQQNIQNIKKETGMGNSPGDLPF